MEAFLHIFGICSHGITGHPTVIGMIILSFTGAFTGAYASFKYILKNTFKKD